MREGGVRSVVLKRVCDGGVRMALYDGQPFDHGLEADAEWEWVSLAMTLLICWQ